LERRFGGGNHDDGESGGAFASFLVGGRLEEENFVF
jgi:hypothetical protein